MNNIEQITKIHIDVPPKMDSQGRSLIGLIDNKMFNFEMSIAEFIKTEQFIRLDDAVKRSIRSWL